MDAFRWILTSMRFRICVAEVGKPVVPLLLQEVCHEAPPNRAALHHLTFVTSSTAKLLSGIIVLMPLFKLYWRKLKETWPSLLRGQRTGCWSSQATPAATCPSSPRRGQGRPRQRYRGGRLPWCRSVGGGGLSDGDAAHPWADVHHLPPFLVKDTRGSRDGSHTRHVGVEHVHHLRSCDRAHFLVGMVRGWDACIVDQVSNHNSQVLNQSQSTQISLTQNLHRVLEARNALVVWHI